MAASILDVLRQGVFVPKPTFTEKNAPDQTGKVHIVTGGYAGCGFELAQLLYQLNATVYVAGRSQEKADRAISRIRSAHPSSMGRVEFLKLDLADLTTIKASADEFMRREQRLDVLTNNAGVMTPPKGSKSAQGYELQLGTNCLGPFLFTQLLLPILRTTAANSPAGSVRVSWGASGAAEMSPKPDGINMEDDGTPIVGNSVQLDYAMSKAGNVFYAKQFARRYGSDGIVSVSWNPGNLETELQRHQGPIVMAILRLMLYPSVNGGYTELFAALSPELTLENNGSYVWPFGRMGQVRRLYWTAKSKEEGGHGAPEKFWFWSERVTKQYL